MIGEKRENRGEQPEEQVDIQEILFRYLIHWPWFVVSVIICIACAWGYLRLATPVYDITATVLIKDDKKGGGASMSSELEKMGLDGFVSSSNNVDNEIEVLKSKSLAREVVNNLGLFVTYKDEDEFPNRELYRTSPVVVSLTPQEAEKLSAPMEVEMTLFPNGGMDALITVKDKEYRKQFDKLPAVFPTDEGTVAFFESKDTLTTNQAKEESKERHIKAFINRPMSVAKGYIKSLSIAPTSKTTSVAVLSLKNSNTRRGKDFINKLLEMYNINANNDKNEVAQKTAEFIDERIGIISKELGSTEQDLENFKRSAGITDLSSEAQIALTGNAEYEKKRVENQTQINLVMDLQRYMQGNEYEVLPSNIGLQDAASAGAIDRYNEMLVERKRLLRTSTENNPTIINLDTSIRAMRSNVQATLDATLKGLQITKEDLAREANRYSRRINDAPTQERQFVSIARQQEIKAGLYLMLLQKREENAITLAATANNAKIIDEALADDNPVSPKRMMVYLAALVLGVGFPVGIIYLIGLTKFKIEGRADVEKLTSLPVIGDIPLADEKSGSIAVFENHNNLMSETFRNVRTNLQFMLENGKNVILVTSTISGEGKSFVSSNLAISLSLLGKKVVIVGLDIRKPGLNKVFNISQKEHGITQFLTNPTKNLMDLVQPSDINKNLFILPGGSVPPNPTELLARDGLEKAIETLKANFDYVILDTAPVGMVTDTLLIGRTADLSVYVCRADVEKLTSLPVIGDIPLADEKSGSIAVFENHNNLMSETFRNVRTNLQFMLENGKNVILVTSTISGEGKSFVSSNLAISLSLLGKKVVIVGLDIRKPGLNKVFNISQKEHGITQFLTNPTKNLMDLVQPSDINKNLFILPGGSVPPNPTELLARDGLEKAIETLKANFDYVILDTAPVGMVTDTLLIGRTADLSVYVCRADYTRKAEFTLINELMENNKLPNLCIAINGLDLQKKKYGYYYGYGKYGKYYGYGKRYGYGYGYGEKHTSREDK